MTRALGIAVVLLLLVATTALAQESGTVDEFERVFVRWMKEHHVARGGLAVGQGDRLVLAKGYGGLTADRRTLIASLSKAITSVCVATLVQEGKVRLDTPLGELLGRRYGPPRDARLRTVTVEQLLTHRAGFGRSHGDPVTGATLGEVLGRRAVSQATMHDLVPGVLRTTLEHDPGTTFVYTNAAHLLLGVGIETVTGRRYEDYCAAAVLRPQGVRDATLDARWGVLGSFGGWSLTGAEYLAFLRTFAPTASLLNADTRAWMLSRDGKEAATAPQFYSLLFVLPDGGQGHHFFHSGSWGYRLSATSRSGAINDSIGTRAMRTASGISWYVVYEPRPDVAARNVLDRDLARAAAAVKTWPDTDLFPALGVRP